MKEKRNITQLFLIIVGIILIIATYFLYPNFKKEEFAVEKEILEDESVEDIDSKSNTFSNVEYKGLYNINKPFTVKSKKAHILKNDPDVVYMSNMKVTLYMNDGRIVIITSDKGNYNKENYDCFFENNVKATDGRTTIRAENLDMLSTEDFASIYNKVMLDNDEGLLWADKVNYDFNTKLYKVTMFNEKKVKIKLFQ